MAFPKRHPLGKPSTMGENFLSPGTRYLKPDSYLHREQAGLRQRGKLRLTESATRISAPASTYGCSTDIRRGKSQPYITTPKRTYIFAGDGVIPLAGKSVFAPLGSRHTTPILSFPTTKNAGCWKKRSS
ncbi:MAG: hypothetical protein ACLR6J_01415 [Parabacteroides merdae]